MNLNNCTTYFYITRHGETDYNKQNKFQGCLINPKLNEIGKNQANELADMFNSLNYDIDCVFTSPLRRAYETASIIGNKMELPIEVNYDLIEGDFGIADGMLKTDIEKLPEYKQWSNLNDLNSSLPNGETKLEIQNRIKNCLKEIYRNNNTGNYIIITHSAVIRCLLLLFGIKMNEIPFKDYFIISYDGVRFRYVTNEVLDNT